MPEHLLIENTDGVALITLNRPSANALSIALLAELRDALEAIENDAAARVVVITGAGEKFFSGGADIKEFGAVDPREQITLGQNLMRRIETFPKPIIAAINGIAFGGGCELLLACHMRFAAEHAQFAQPEIRLGIIPGWGGTQRLPKLIGKGRALELMLTGDRLSAQDAERFGLVNHVYPAAELLSETMAFAKRLAQGAPLAQRATLLVTNEGLEHGYNSGIEMEREQMLHLTNTEDAGIGIAAFVMKSEAEFVGR